MCERYKILNKIPLFLPIFWFVRGIEVLLFRRKSIKTWTKVWKQMDDDTVNEYQKHYKFVGLDIDDLKYSDFELKSPQGKSLELTEFSNSVIVEK